MSPFAYTRDLPRRFYKRAEARERGDMFTVTLDGRTLKTPAKANFETPTRALAQACADEWDAQAELIRAETMPITRLVNVALDWTPGAREELAAQVARFGETDLLCHRAASPAPLVARETRIWEPLLVWGRDTLGAPLVAGVGVLPRPQPDAALAALARAAEELGDFHLTGVAHAAGLAGSAIIAFALARGAVDVEAAFAAAALDELYQIETWGEDHEARRRLDGLKSELAALAVYFAALA